MSTVSDIEGLLNGLITLTDVEEGKEDEFAEAQRTAFDTQQANPLTAIEVNAGVFIVEPPADCPEATFKAQEELQEFSDDLGDILTYKSWL